MTLAARSGGGLDDGLLPGIESSEALLPDSFEFGVNDGSLHGREFLLFFEVGESLGHGDTAEIGDQAAQSVGTGAGLWHIVLLDGAANLLYLMGNILNNLGEQPQVIGHADDCESLELVIVEERGWWRRI